MNKTNRLQIHHWQVIAISVLFTALLQSACSLIAIQGSGNLVTETRSIREIERVSLEGMGEVIVTQSGEESLNVETDDNMMQYVQIEVRDGTLYLDIDTHRTAILSPSRLIYHLNVKDLAGMSILGSGDIRAVDLAVDRLEAAIDGSGDVEIDSLAAGMLELKISGSGNVAVNTLTADQVMSSIRGSGEVNLAGEATTQEINISGSGRYNAGRLRSETVEVSISGSGNAVLWGTDYLRASTSGSGSVTYYGNPTVDFSGSGSGDIKHLGEKQASLTSP